MASKFKPSTSELIEKINHSIQIFELQQNNETEILELINQVQQSIHQTPETGKELGKYIALLKKTLYSKGSIPELSFYGIYKGNLCIGHKPGKKLSCLNLKRGGIGIVVTLLQENEGALLIGSQVEKENLQWIWFPFSASNPTRNQTEVLDFFLSIENALKSGQNIYIHCSAGIHRTGMVTYGFLRFIGYSPHESKTILAHLREVTFNQVGANRLTWGDQFFSGRA